MFLFLVETWIISEHSPLIVGATAGSKFDFQCVKLFQFRLVQEFVLILMIIHSVIITGMGTFSKM